MDLFATATGNIKRQPDGSKYLMSLATLLRKPAGTQRPTNSTPASVRAFRRRNAASAPTPPHALDRDPVWLASARVPGT
jgi:hypothetical protein